MIAPPRKSARSLLVSILLAIAWNPAGAALVSYQQGVSPSSSYSHLGATIFQNAPTTNDGLRGVLGVGRTPHGLPGGPSIGLGNIRSVLGFDLANIPAGAIINSATLTMTLGEIEGTDPGRMDLFAISPSQAIVEGTGIYGVGPDNGVSWNSASVGVPWTPGGDYLPTSLAAVNPIALGALIIGPTNGLTAAIQTAKDNNLPLQLLLVGTSAELGASTNGFVFYSDDAADAANRPLLSVDFTAVPEPSALILFLAGSVISSARMRYKRYCTTR